MQREEALLLPSAARIRSGATLPSAARSNPERNERRSPSPKCSENTKRRDSSEPRERTTGERTSRAERQGISEHGEKRDEQRENSRISDPQSRSILLLLLISQCHPIRPSNRNDRRNHAFTRNHPLTNANTSPPVRLTLHTPLQHTTRPALHLFPPSTTFKRQPRVGTTGRPISS